MVNDWIPVSERLSEEQQACKLASEQALSDFKRMSELAENIMMNMRHLAERLEESEISGADVREVMEAIGYKHLICPHCLSEYYAKTKAEMFCPDCGKKFFFSEKQFDFPYVGENIE